MSTSIAPSRKQKGIATLLLVAMVGLAISTLSMAVISTIHGAQKSSTAISATIQSQVKAWQGLKAIWDYLDQPAIRSSLAACFSNATNCPDISLTSADGTIVVAIPKLTAYNASAKTVTITATGTSGGSKSILESVYALTTVDSTTPIGGAWQFGTDATFNGNPTFTNIPALQYLQGKTLTLHGSGIPPTQEITALPPVDVNVLKSKANLVVYVDKNSSCTGGMETSASANTSTNTCLIVSNVKTSTGTSLDGVYRLTCISSGSCTPTGTALAANWAALCNPSSCISRSNPAGSSVGGTWTVSPSFVFPGVVWMQGDLNFNAGTYVKSFITSGDFNTGGDEVVLTAPNRVTSADSVCKASVSGIPVAWPTNLCTSYGGALVFDGVANTALISGGSDLVNIKKLTVKGNMLVMGSLTADGNTDISGTLIVYGSAGLGDTFNGSKFTGDTSSTGTIVTTTTEKMKSLWLRYL